MEQLPDFWRTEVYHPLSVHFPLALLFTAFIFKLLALKFHREVWELGGSVLLILGTLGAWIAIYTGNLADGAVSRQLCDPTVLKNHENMGYYTAWLFTVSTGLELLKFSKKIVIRRKGLIKITILLLMALGTGTLFYSGHLGASLVYQQGAGVYKPGGDCAEFN